MNSNKLLGAAVIFGGVVVMGMALASANAAPEQLGDPFIEHFSKHVIRYFIIATAALFSGGIIAAFGGVMPGTGAP